MVVDHYIICHPDSGERFGRASDLTVAVELARAITFDAIRQNTCTPTVVRAMPGEQPVAAFRPLPTPVPSE